jgi:hypothetical protein
VNAVPHSVRGQRPLDLVDNVFVRRNFREGERFSRTTQPREMFVELKDAPVIQPQPFPDRIAALHRGIKGADARPVPLEELAVDVDQQIAVLLVELLEHLLPM